MSHTFVVVSMTTASVSHRFFLAHSRNLPISILCGDSSHSCAALIPPARTYSLWMSNAMYRSISLVFWDPFMLNSFWFVDWDVDFWVEVAGTDSGLACCAIPD